MCLVLSIYLYIVIENRKSLVNVNNIDVITLEYTLYEELCIIFCVVNRIKKNIMD